MTASPLACPRAIIDLSAIRHNLGRCRELNPNQPIMPVVKANAYGHGAVAIATELFAAGAEAVCVARLDEALALRAANISGEIVILEGVYNAEALSQALAADLTLVLHDAQQVAALTGNLQIDTAKTVWLKLETGMHRLGAPLEQAAKLAADLQAKPWCKEVGWFTHLACADEHNSAGAKAQIDQILAIAKHLGGPVSFANSAATAAWPSQGWLRPGIMLYGGSPLLNKTAVALDLKPVMTLETPLLAVKEIPAGADVGYGATWQAKRPSRIGIAAIGYGDGYPRCLSSVPDKPDTEVFIAGHRCPVIGRVSMDKITVDLTDHPNTVTAGEVVQLWGNDVSVDEVASRAGTISYELLCGIAPRVHRHYK